MIKMSSRKYKFGSIDIALVDQTEIDYGCCTWQSALIMADFIIDNKNLFVDKIVLEIGAGAALPGILCSKIGCSVVLTDIEYKHEKMVYKTALNNCKINRVDAKMDVLDWNSAFIGALDKFDRNVAILGSDVFFSSKDFNNILSTISAILEICPNSIFYSVYQIRSLSKNIKLINCIDKLGLVLKKDHFIAENNESSFVVLEIARKSKEASD
ncbi:hypothetical protein MHBO_001468 [Bonamia ostreae]|uniref:Methyltransferase n=1 Tax=Bonamia ostreae TaxID=126728 RepID=A0ABV2AJP2_9EUKA